MIRLVATREAAERHAQATLARVKMSYDEQSVLSSVQKLGAESIEDFLTADVAAMRKWTQESPEKLKFTCFAEIYFKYFSNGPENYVDGDYNAYSLIESLGITVCPYCDDEYLDIVNIGGKTKRTSEIDHFFPKSKYPALAMCFYNLIPSGQNCNGLKKEHEIGANPHEDDIELWTWLYPDIPVGETLEAMPPDECKVRFHPQNGMKHNVDMLALEQRYERHAPEVHRLLCALQNFSEEKIEELIRMGCYDTREQVISSVFGPQDPKEKKKSLRQKMLKDLTGY